MTFILCSKHYHLSDFGIFEKRVTEYTDSRLECSLVSRVAPGFPYEENLRLSEMKELVDTGEYGRWKLQISFFEKKYYSYDSSW